MHRYSEARVLPHSPEQLFSLVLDIEKYPEFLPWCRASRIVSREQESFQGELMIRFAHLTERYTSRITPMRGEQGELGIDVTLVSGPFKQLTNHWRFIPQNQGCEIQLDLEFAFKSALLDKMMGGVFTRACEKMIGAFTERARTLYGNQR